MNSHYGRASARPEEPITSAILRGAAWKARRIRCNCLRQHCRAVATTFRGREYDTIREICIPIFQVLESRSRILTEIHPTELSVVAAVARLGAYAPFWLRQPEDWHPDPAADARSQWADLLRHLLARFPVPAFLDSVWTRGGSLEHFDRDCWCALAQGRSLRTVSGFPRSIPHRVLHAALTNYHPDLARPWHRETLPLAIWRAQLRFLNASPALEGAVLASRIPRELGNYALWSRLVAKFSATRDVQPEELEFTANGLTAACAYCGHVKVERLMKLPLQDLVRHCRRFVADLVEAQGHSLADPLVREAVAKADLSKLLHSRWPRLLAPAPIPLATFESAEAHCWFVEELSSITDLQEESRVMKHCVETFASKCRVGHSSIFSVRHREPKADGKIETTSYATIEVRRQSMQVVQVRAYRNRPANNTVMNFVRDWAAENDLVCAV